MKEGVLGGSPEGQKSVDVGLYMRSVQSYGPGMVRPVFADPKTDLVFKRIFGTEAHKNLLIALLNDLLGLDAPHRIVDLEYLTPEQVPHLDGHKLSIVDVKCLDAAGTRY